jgi:hypothetical protein
MSQFHGNPLAPMLLDIAGRYTVDPYDGRRHYRILKEAYPYLTPEEQAQAKARMHRLETKWGNLLNDDYEADAKLSETEVVQLIAQWLSKRRGHEVLLKILKRAAEAVNEGTEYLRDIEEEAYEGIDFRTARPVSYNTFERWLLQMRVAQKVKLQQREHWQAPQIAWKPGAWNHHWRGQITALVEEWISKGAE